MDENKKDKGIPLCVPKNRLHAPVNSQSNANMEKPGGICLPGFRLLLLGFKAHAQLVLPIGMIRTLAEVFDFAL